MLQQMPSDMRGRIGTESAPWTTRRGICTGLGKAARVTTGTYSIAIGETGLNESGSFNLQLEKLFPAIAPADVPDIEPGLPSALESLTRNQRVAVVLIHGLAWTEHEAAELLGVSRSTVRTHAERGLSRLRTALEVTIDA